jgi:iron complex outermembrane receptor protein
MVPAAAQTVALGSSAIEEVTVTSTRRAEDIQKTPLAVTSLGSEALDKSNVNDLAGLNGLVPSLSVTKEFGFETVITIRGIGSETPQNSLSTSPGVAMFVDGVYIANTISLDQALFDLDHVEVLRGPQGALYGQSATGGAVTLVSRQPELGHFSGAGDFSIGNYNYYRERAEVNVPATDSIAVRASAQKLDHDGFTTNMIDPSYKLDDSHNSSGKVAVLWKPIDTLTATLTGMWYSEDEHGAAIKSLVDPNPDPRVVSWDYNPKFNLDSQLYHLNLDYEAPWFDVKSVSAYQNMAHRQKQDATFNTVANLGSYNDIGDWSTELQAFSEELDLLSRPDSKLNWISGVFLLNQKMDQFVAEFTGTTPNPPIYVGPDIETKPPSNLSYGNYTNVQRRSYAPFLQATYPVLDTLRLTAGVRYNYEAYKLANQNFSAFGFSTTPGTTFTTHLPTWRGQAEYDLTANSLLYASVSRGYKPGGVNGNPSAVVVPLFFKPETNTDYEVGSKNFLFDKKLRANFAAFYDEYHNMQYIEADPFPFADSMANIPSVRIYGAESEFSYLAMQDKLHLNVNLSVEKGQVEGATNALDSTIVANVENNNPNCGYGGPYYNPKCWSAVVGAERNLAGNSPPNMPTVSGSINASYDFQLHGGKLSPRLEYVYRGEVWARIFNEPGLDKVKAYGLVNGNLTYLPEASNLTLSFAATNILNKAAANSKYTNPYEENSANYTHETGLQFVPPRQFIGTVGYSF